jgi:hypothetical protein
MMVLLDGVSSHELHTQTCINKQFIIIEGWNNDENYLHTVEA